MRVLVAEAADRVRKAMVRRLQREGYSLDSCAGSEEALAFLEATEYDAVILSLELPEAGGLEILEQLRQRRCPVPVLMLAAGTAVEERVLSLDAGADDCLARPFEQEEMSARLRVLVRRKAGGNGSNVFTCADLTLDIHARMAWRGGRSIQLTQKEFAVLEYLVLNQDIVLSRSQIEEHVWNNDFNAASNVVDVYVRYLRRKLDTGFSHRLIHTVRGAGYVLKSAGEQMPGR